MFYDVVVNEWGETTYVPTTLGNVLLVILIIALLGGAVAFARTQRKKKLDGAESARKPGGRLTARQLAFCAMAIALGTVLSNVKLFEFPTGGSITLLSMLAACLPGYFFGLGEGIMTGVAYGVL
ncbi:MAG: energy-coupled thiamine transporter ThiT, partial [Acetatifactor sp.]|nr:energy-coupled thiamine transporter ThiT [Acetatifactor sp.]